YNLGNGKGYSVRQVIDTAKKVTGVDFEVTETARRPGDPTVLIASSERIAGELGWEAKHPSLEEIIASAWEWHSKNPQGYD
ncbi:MAG: UDP-glucose 4-epimerase GalE, partial [Actinomycetota bacterium]